MEGFKLKPFMKPEDKGCEKYMRDMEEYIMSFEASGIKRVLVSIDNVSVAISEDLDLLLSGGSEMDCRILNDNKDSKLFDRAMVLVKSSEAFALASKAAMALRPEVEEWVDPSKRTIKVNRTENIFEDIQEKMLKKHAEKAK